jgi:hypothetical protein
LSGFLKPATVAMPRASVGWDDKNQKPCLVREFRLSDAAGF